VVLLLVEERPSLRDVLASAGLGGRCFGLMPWFWTAGIQHIPAARAAL